MTLHKHLAFLLIAASSVFAMDFADYDTTVQVKTFTRDTTDSTFIPLRNTGFTLSYTLRATECPVILAQGDFEVRPDSKWRMQLTQDMGDSAFHHQSSIMGFCDTAMYFRQFLPPKSKYQLHMVMNKNLKMDTLYTMVTAQPNDSTFTLAVSARTFGVTSVRTRVGPARDPKSPDVFSADGKRIGPHSRVWIDRTGKKEIDLHTN